MRAAAPCSSLAARHIGTTAGSRSGAVLLHTSHRSAGVLLGYAHRRDLPPADGHLALARLCEPVVHASYAPPPPPPPPPPHLPAHTITSHLTRTLAPRSAARDRHTTSRPRTPHPRHPATRRSGHLRDHKLRADLQRASAADQDRSADTQRRPHAHRARRTTTLHHEEYSGTTY
eukprot:COSAG02_NODE_425_length_22574_cov_29.550300_5_plen_174_part_00